MDFLRELLKMKEGFMPDLESMTDQQLVDLCREIGEEDACKMDADGRLVNREQLIRDIQTGSIGDADIDTPMDPHEDVDMSYDHVERDHDEAYEPDQQDVDHNEDAIRDDMGEQQPMEAYTNLRKSFNFYKPVKMKKGLMQKGVKTTKENVDMEQARTMHRWREADLQHRDEDARAEVSVPREIDRTKHANALAVWNDSMQKQETLEMVWPKLVAAMQTIKESTYKKIPGSLGGKKVAKVLLKEDTIPVVKFKDPYNKLVTPAHGGLQKDVTNKSADKAIEDEIGDAGTKGMKKKDRPYMEKPRFRDWLTANMIFNMTRSGELAGNMQLGEGREHAGNHPAAYRLAVKDLTNGKYIMTIRSDYHTLDLRVWFTKNPANAGKFDNPQRIVDKISSEVPALAKHKFKIVKIHREPVVAREIEDEGELAGNRQLGEGREYAGKHPKKIKMVSGQGKGTVVVTANDGTKHTVHAKDVGGNMPKVGELISTYVKESESEAGKKKISEAKQMCEWFARCKNPATGTTPHPVLGKVPTCDRCHKFATNEVRKEKLGENDPFNHQSDKLAQLKYDYQQRQKKLTAAKKNRTSREGTKLKGAAPRRTEK